MISPTRLRQLLALGAAAIACVIALSPTASATTSPGDVSDRVEAGASWLEAQQTAATGAIPGFGGDWATTALAAAGVHAADLGSPSLQDHLFSQYSGVSYKGNPTRPATDYENAILNAYAAGIEPSSVAVDQNLIAQLAGRWSSSSSTFGSSTIVNGQIYALLSLGRTHVPKSVLARIVGYIRSNVHEDGGFGSSTVESADDFKSDSEIDTTGAALAGLCEGGVTAGDPAVVAARKYLAGSLLENGAFDYVWGANTDATAWVVNGLNACGIDPQGSDFTSDTGNTPIDYLVGNQIYDELDPFFGAFNYDDTGGMFSGPNLYSTQDAVRSLAGEAFTSNPPERANPSDPIWRPAPNAVSGTSIPVALLIDDATGTLHFCKVTTTVGATAAQVLTDAQTASYPAGCVSQLTTSGIDISSINGATASADGGWKVSFDDGAETDPDDTGIALGQTLALRLDHAAVTFGSQSAQSVGGSKTFKFFATDGTSKIRDVALTGDNPDDFLVVQDNCTGSTLLLGESCQIRVRFAPAAAGARSATLSVAGAPNDATYEFSGTGTEQASGAQGPAGNAGAQGPKGDTGAQGPAGKDGKSYKTTCKLVKKHGKVASIKCTQTVATAVTAKSASATLLKGSRVVASGRLSKLAVRRKLASGSYILVLRSGKKVEAVPVTVAVNGSRVTISRAG